MAAARLSASGNSRNVLQASLGREVDRGLVYFGAASDQPGTVFFYPGSLRLADSDGARTLQQALASQLLEIRVYNDFAPEMKYLRWRPRERMFRNFRDVNILN